MAKCTQCGAEVPDDVKICPACGASMEEPESPKAPETETPAEPEAPVAETPAAETPAAEDKKIDLKDLKEKVGDIAAAVKDKANDAAEEVKNQLNEAKAAEEAAVAEEFDPEDIKKNKLMSVLAYLGILVIIPILAAKDSKFARFHTNQGLILFISSIIVSLLAYIPVIKWFAWVVDILIFILAIMGIINAAKGQVKELPVIGKYKILK